MTLKIQDGIKTPPSEIIKFKGGSILFFIWKRKWWTQIFSYPSVLVFYSITANLAVYNYTNFLSHSFHGLDTGYLGHSRAWRSEIKVLAGALFSSEAQGPALVGRIQFLTAVKLRSLLYCWLSARCCCSKPPAVRFMLPAPQFTSSEPVRKYHSYFKSLQHQEGSSLF